MSHCQTASLKYTDICRSILDGGEKGLQSIIAQCESQLAGSSTIIDGDIETMVRDTIDDCKSMISAIDQKRALLTSAVMESEIQYTRSSISEINTVYLKSQAVASAINDVYLVKMDSSRSGIESAIQSMADSELKTMMKILARNKKYARYSADELKDLAESKLDPEKKVDSRFIADVAEDMRGRMEEEHVSPESIEAVFGDNTPKSPLEIMNAGMNEILDESLRRRAVKAIIGSITVKGFVVSKSNIRHDRETNTVTIVAQKPGGQVARFKLTIDGKFAYDFDGYEGLACEKDISALEHDLEEVYGIKLVDKNVTWSNPDKVANMHHAEMKVRRSG